MKKKVLLLAAAAMLSVGASAQLSLGLKAGYAFGANGMNLGTSTEGTKTTNVYGSYGQGIPVGLEVAYFFNDNIGVQLDAAFLIGTKVLNDETLTAGFEDEIYTKTTQLRLSPQLVLKTDIGIYGRIGAVLPVMGSTTRFASDQNGGGPGVLSESEVKSKGKFSVGFVGVVGYQFNLSDQLSLFGEVEYIGLGIKRASTEITKFEVGGTDVLNTLPADQINQDYEDEVDAGSTTALSSKSQYSSIGLNIGVRFTLGGK